MIHSTIIDKKYNCVIIINYQKFNVLRIIVIDIEQKCPRNGSNTIIKT